MIQFSESRINANNIILKQKYPKVVDMKEAINWRQLYNESQMIRPEDNEVSTEVIEFLKNEKGSSIEIIFFISVFVDW